MVRPINQFCCGCSLIFGATLIISLHLVQILVQLALITSNVILKIPTFGSSVALPTQAFNAGLCLLGLPLLASAFYGVFQRQEGHLRFYLYYLYLIFAVDLLFIIIFFADEDMCLGLPAVLKVHGAAFACGCIRIFSVFFTATSVSVEVYFIFSIWSLCEDLKAGGEDSGSGLPQLLRQKDVHTMRRYKALMRGEDEPEGRGEINVAYGAFAAATGNTIFGGGWHDTGYPPA